MLDTSSSSPPLWVACLCADWCGTCRDYRQVFEQVALAHPELHFVWVDIEDESEFVDPLEVENFPTLLIADAQGARFFGTVLPHKDTLVRLVRSQRESASAPAASLAPDVHALAKRLLARS